MRSVHVSTAYRHGTPLRSWTDEPPDIAAGAAELAIKASDSVDAIRKLLRKEPVTVAEQLSLGRLNSHCFLMGYEPMVLLYDFPRIDPAIPPLLEQHSKHFRTP